VKPTSLVLLPDDLTHPIRILRIGPEHIVEQFNASLPNTRTGEDGFPTSNVRRYELAHYPHADQADLMVRRVVIQDPANCQPYSAASWVRRDVGLHPERRDVASWFRAARMHPDATWQAHLGIVLRDALRSLDASRDALLVMPDRAYLAASDDDRTTLPPGVLQSLTAAVRSLDHTARQTGTDLPPIILSDVGIVHRRRGIVTRAQAVIAEALMNSHDSQLLPTPDTIIDRWVAAVDDDHAARIRQTGATEWAAPVAILDDHRNGRATLILATVNISLEPTRPDVWFAYHEVMEIATNRPVRLDLSARLMAGSEPVDDNRAALLTAIHEQALPVLELSTNNHGSFDNRLLSDLLPDPIPLLRRHPAFEVTGAVIAYLHFLDANAHREPSALPWAPASDGTDTGGGTGHSGGGPANQKPKRSDMPPGMPGGIKTFASAPGRESAVGGDAVSAVEVDVHGTAHASTATKAEADQAGTAWQEGDETAAGEEGQDDGEEDRSGDEGSRGGGGTVSGALDLRNDPPADAMIAVQIAMTGGETDMAGTEDDIPFTGLDATARMTDAIADDEHDEIDGETDAPDAHESPDIAIADDPAGWLDRLYAEMSDTDNQIIRHIRLRVTALRAEKGSAAGAPEVPSDDALTVHAVFVSKAMHNAAQLVAASKRPGTTKAFGQFKPLIEEGPPWLRLLAALNIAGVAQTELPNNRQFRMNAAKLGNAADACHKQAKLVGIEIRYPSERRPDNQMTGGGNA
jgi:hypothetical protein